MWCDICEFPLKFRFNDFNVYAKDWSYKGNLKLCYDCINRIEKNPYNVIEELIEAIDDLNNKIEELEEQNNKHRD